MGTVFEILFPAELRSRMEAAHRALDRIRGLEDWMTVFRSDSLISRLNREACERPVPVALEVFELLRLSLELGAKTDWAFDVAAGALWSLWGFQEKAGRIPSREEIDSVLGSSGARLVVLDAEASTVFFRRTGVQLNLGSIGKGFALDRAAELLQNAGVGVALLHAGNSSFLGLGDASPKRRGWKISIRHPLDKATSFVTLRLRNQGMGTSGTGEQFFEVDGKRYGHIIDPRSGLPVDRTLSASAIAPTAAVADALSTAFFALGLEEVESFCEENPDVGAIIIPRPLAGDELRMHCFGVAGSCIEAE